MTAKEVKLARYIAQSDRDLSAYDDSVLYGCLCPDFKHPVYVSIFVVAKLMRWQYCGIFNLDYWDESAFNDERWVYQKRIQVSDLTSEDVQTVLRDQVLAALRGGLVARG